jgi:hypothetical protein
VTTIKKVKSARYFDAPKLKKGLKMKAIFEVQGLEFSSLKQAVKHAKKYDFSHIYNESGDLIVLVIKLQQGFDIVLVS